MEINAQTHMEKPALQKAQNLSRQLQERASAGTKQVRSPQTEEFRRYFPGLYDGRVSTDQIHRPELGAEPVLSPQTEDEKLKATAQEFQSLFIKIMLSSMRATLKPENDMLGGGRGQEIFKDMLFDQYALLLSRDNAFNLDEQMVNQLQGRPAAPLSPALQARASQAYQENE